jgi:hypothetical protein
MGLLGLQAALWQICITFCYVIKPVDINKLVSTCHNDISKRQQSIKNQPDAQ